MQTHNTGFNFIGVNRRRDYTFLSTTIWRLSTFTAAQQLRQLLLISASGCCGVATTDVIIRSFHTSTEFHPKMCMEMYKNVGTLLQNIGANTRLNIIIMEHVTSDNSLRTRCAYLQKKQRRQIFCIAARREPVISSGGFRPDL